MAIVAGLFNSQMDATEAMDRLLRMNIEDLDTHVIEPGQNSDSSGAGSVIPIVPNTGNPGSGFPGTAGPLFVPTSRGAGFDWRDKMGETESVFYQEGLREGATLALAKVDDDHAAHIRQLFRAKGARTYIED